MRSDLDPHDWPAFRAQAHRMLDDMLDYTEHIRTRTVWQPIPPTIRAQFQAEIPTEPVELASVHEEFMQQILPYATGNVHPGFMGWVHGAGTPVGMLAEMLAAGLNANLGGRDHIPIEVERQIVRWMAQLFGFPASASGLFVTGTSMANLLATLIARDAAAGTRIRQRGVAATSNKLVAYTSTAGHACLTKAMDIAGLGSDALRLIPTDHRGRMDVAALEIKIEHDRRHGFSPFLVTGTAGTTDTGAIDDLTALADVCERQNLWFHVDGAFGALAMLSPELAPRLAGIERADSLAFDFHKWGQVPYDAGFLLVRDAELHQQAFASPAAYLRRESRGLAAGSPWPCDFGPDLSRGFRALKTWFTLKVYGTEAIGATIAQTCALARHLAKRVAAEAELELLAPAELNIVCFRYRAPWHAETPGESNRLNQQIVVELQERGSVAPSSTSLNGRFAIRAAIVNHRTTEAEVDTLVDQTLALGRHLQTSNPAHWAHLPKDSAWLPPTL
jgi:glutamate/tyrosine decarboxylase-like PLP-dependent enzyme